MVKNQRSESGTGIREVSFMQIIGRALAALFVLSALMVVYSAPSVSEEAARPTYVGSQRCKMCHMPQFRAWEAGPKAKAWEAIKDAADKEKCYACHTTGFGQPGGFTSIEATPNLAGVGCESCHGPGSAHVAMPASNRDAAARAATTNKFITDCRTCHNPHVLDTAAAARDTAARR